MIRILPVYIVRQHIGPFLFGLVVITFVLVMDLIVDYLDLFLGRGVPFTTVLEVFFLSLGWMLALSIPMAVLVATLMAFGRLSQDHEIAAMRAGGLSFVQILTPVLLVSALLSGGLFAYNDRILPSANHRLANLLLDIHRKKPAIAIREGRFVNVQGYSIHVRHLDERTSRMEDVRINRTREGTEVETIFAERGRMETSPDGNTLTLYLEDGEIHRVDETAPTRFNRLRFEKHQINLRGIGSELTRSDRKQKGDREMSIAEMRARIALLKKELAETRGACERESLARARKLVGLVADPGPRVMKYSGRLEEPATARPEKPAAIVGGGIRPVPPPGMRKAPATRPATAAATAERAAPPAESAARPIESAARPAESAQENLTALIGAVNRWRGQEVLKAREQARFEVEVQKKLAIPCACWIFILIGGPLGIRVGRGGIGAGAGLSLGFFLLYYLCLVGGEELADRLLISPFVAMWTANILFTGVGIWLTFGLVKQGTGVRA